MTSRAFAVLALALALVVPSARSASFAQDRPTPAASASPSAADRDVHARGQLLAVARPYIIFITGDALRLRAGTVIPDGATLGSAVFVSIDRAGRDVYAVSREARAVDEIDVANIPRDFVVVSPKSARLPIDPHLRAVSATLPGAKANVTLEVTVPANTPPSDDVYVSTDRSNFSPAEIRMQRIDSRRFTVTIPLDSSGKLRYQYTRGSYATVERDRSGGIVEPHVADVANARDVDTVTRWADTN